MKHLIKQALIPATLRHPFRRAGLLLCLLVAAGTSFLPTDSLLPFRLQGISAGLALSMLLSGLTRHPVQQMRQAQSAEPPAPFREMFLVQSATHRVPVGVDEICYFFRVGRHTFLRTFDRKDYLIPESLQQVQAMLDPACFFRVNRQLLMHYKAFRSYKPAGYGKLELDLHLAPPFPAIVSQVKAPAFRHWMQR